MNMYESIRSWAYLLCGCLGALAMGCGSYEPLPEYTGVEDGDACGPCGKGTFTDEVCVLGALDGLIDTDAECTSIIHVDAATTSEVSERDGSPERPYASITRALEVAGEQEASVVLVAGDGALYEGPLVVAAGIHILGGWAPGSFDADEDARPLITTTGTREMSQVVGMTARGIAARTLITRLGVRTQGEAHTHIGALLEDSALLELSEVELFAGPGGDGTPGESGSAGSPGGDGGNGGLDMSFGAGGVNDRCDPSERRGGDGGVGAFRSGQGTTPAREGQRASSGAEGGDPGRSGFEGLDGQEGPHGTDGSDGAVPSLGAFDRAQWVVETGESGMNGTPGGGGGGGGGGADQNEISRGGAGGGGGAGGCAGTGGNPGTPAGSSFGALIITTGPVFGEGVRIAASDGGDGGASGAGGVGGTGGVGGVGGGEELATAGSGGAGGDGGDGGAGSPGAPGHSVAVYCIGGGIDVSGAMLVHGSAGAWPEGTSAPKQALATESTGCKD